MVMLVTQCQLPRMVCTSRTTPATGSHTKIQMLLCGILKETLAATTGKREVAVCCFIGLTSFLSTALQRHVYSLLCREAKCGGVNTIRRLVMYHPDTVNAQLHTVILAMLNEVSHLILLYLLQSFN